MCHLIDAGEAPSVSQPSKTLPLARQVVVVGEIFNKQRCRIFEESDSPWSPLDVLAQKKNRDLCFCVDYIKLNDLKQ